MRKFLAIVVLHCFVHYSTGQSVSESSAYENLMERLKVLTTNGTDSYFEGIQNRTREIRNKKFTQMLSFKIGKEWLTSDLSKDENFMADSQPHLFLGSHVTQTLTEWLLEGYDSWLPPPAIQIMVVIDIHIQGILDLDTHKQQVEYLIWLHVKWEDPRLSWEGLPVGIHSVRLSPNSIWMPDLTVQNALSVQVVSPPFVTVSPGGQVSAGYPMRIRTYCKSNMQLFPMDSQTCILEFLSMSFSASELFLSTKELRIHESDGFNDFSEFRITETYISHKSKAIFGILAANERQVVQYVFTFTRNSRHFQALVAFPSFLVSFVALLGLFTPTSSDIVRRERVSFGSLFMVAMIMLLVLIPVYAHPSGTTLPRIGVFVIFQLVLLTIATGCSVLILLVERRALYNKTVPESIRAFVKDKRVVKSNEPVQPGLINNVRDGLAQRAGDLIFQPKYLNDSMDIGTRRRTDQHKGDVHGFEMSYDSHYDDTNNVRHNGDFANRNDHQYRSFKKEKLAFLIKNLVNEIRGLCSTLELQTSQQSHSPGEWHRVASRLDLICFVVFTVILIIGTLCCLLLK